MTCPIGVCSGSSLVITVADVKRYPEMWSKAFAYARQLLNFAADVRSNDPCGKVVTNAYSRSASGYGTGFNNTASTTEKIAVFAPIPSARVRTATVAKPGDFRKLRRAYRTSWSKASIETSAPVRIRAAHPLLTVFQTFTPAGARLPANA